MKPYQARIAIMQSALRPAAKFVAIRIFDAQGLKDGACTLSVARLAEDCGLPVGTAKRALRELAAGGVLTVDGAPGARARRRLDLSALVVPPVAPVPWVQPVSPVDRGGATSGPPGVSPVDRGGATSGTSYREGSERDLEKDLRRAEQAPAAGPHKLHAVYVRRRRTALPAVALKRTGPMASEWDPFWEKLDRQVSAQAELDGSTPADVARRVYAGLFADEWAAGKGYPPSMLLSKFEEYVQSNPARRPKPQPERWVRYQCPHTYRPRVVDAETGLEWYADEETPQAALDAGYVPQDRRAA